MNKKIGIALGILIIAVIGYIMFTQDKTDKKELINEVPVVNSVTEVPIKDTEVPTTRIGSYENYSSEKIMLAASGDVILFFNASWCPSCRALNSDIDKNISSIPTGTVILKVDYDKETALKKKYGVTYQHTLVQVDKDGNLIKKWSGSSKLENLLSQIQ